MGYNEAVEITGRIPVISRLEANEATLAFFFNPFRHYLFFRTAGGAPPLSYSPA
jgi:hypothetical protein